ncbi:tetratricopeptide repeat protein [Marilutibacter aestuarii]|nr:tetratricopeptide repeat protein [Lysobacter aestuarii]
MSTPALVFTLLALLLAVGALGWALRPLWRSSPAAGTGAVLALVVLTGILYGTVGMPPALDPANRVSAMPETLDQAIAQLEGKLDQDPDQPEGWRLLGNAYQSQGEMAKAAHAFGKALEYAPDDPDLLTELAESRAMNEPQRRFDAEAVAMLEHAVEVQPMHQRARWFLGIARRQAGDAAAAAEVWEPLLAIVDASTARPLREQIALARSEAGLPPLPEPAETPAPAGVTIAVSLDPQLGMRLPANATLFVLARQPGGPPMPVAAKKLPVTGFPLTVELTDADSPMPTQKLSQLETVELVARISASGDARAAPGDFTSAPVEVETGEGAKAALLIDQVVE